jgi:hypothetical protein
MFSDPLFLSRLQFAWVIAWHILLPAFTVGLASYIAVLEGIYFATGRDVYFRSSMFWIKIFSVSFGMAGTPIRSRNRVDVGEIGQHSTSASRACFRPLTMACCVRAPIDMVHRLSFSRTQSAGVHRGLTQLFIFGRFTHIGTILS